MPPHPPSWTLSRPSFCARTITTPGRTGGKVERSAGGGPMGSARSPARAAPFASRAATAMETKIACRSFILRSITDPRPGLTAERMIRSIPSTTATPSAIQLVLLTLCIAKFPGGFGTYAVLLGGADDAIEPPDVFVFVGQVQPHLRRPVPAGGEAGEGNFVLRQGGEARVVAGVVGLLELVEEGVEVVDAHGPHRPAGADQLALGVDTHSRFRGGRGRRAEDRGRDRRGEIEGEDETRNSQAQFGR
jgi:hypothetical protein